MAHLSNYISFLLFTTLFLALQISARDSQFFSKVSHFDTNNVKETELPNKEAPEVNKVEQQPPFIPETENSYGLYGHDEYNQVPSTTTTKNSASYTTPTSYHPYKTEFEDNNKYFNNDAYNNRFTETGYNNKKYYKKDSYRGDQYQLSDAKYTEEGYNNNKYNNYQNDNQKYYSNDADNHKYYNNNFNGNGNSYNGEKQGMSDTRFLHGGRYFYDLNAENSPPTNYGDSSGGVNTNTWYNNRGGKYNEYQNQEEFEDEQKFEP
ncbi:unnamed protein product [Sphenostylis stenocarpa]|uniref:Protein E6 n=1 Tax=Sphenostylis stenocarpa TaxID=92480 RepID=A0AA86SW93_9FABA|nr:unnamed protein product [Sphenostylis stenocarpa]